MLNKKNGIRIFTMFTMMAVAMTTLASSPTVSANETKRILDVSNLVENEQDSIDKVNLGTAGDFVILTKTGITTTGTTMITGNIGVSPAAATYMTGFGLILDASSSFSNSSLVVGNVYAADYALDTPVYLTVAMLDMEAAYLDAAGRAADYTELHAGDLSEKTLEAGVYKYSTSVVINKDLVLNGSATDVFIFQISGTLTQASNTNIILTGGVLAENIIWQVADVVAIGTGAHFEGTILAKTNITLNTEATVNGKLFAQTAVTLIANKIVG